MLVSIVVPAHNEDDNLPKLMGMLQSASKSMGGTEIILVDDHSTDGTAQLCDSYTRTWQNVRTVHRRSGNPGMGNALKEGTREAKGDVIVWTMADLSDDIETIPRMVNRVAEGADMVFASRYMKGGSIGDLSRTKSLMSRGFTFVSRLFLGVKVHDITNAFRAFRKDVFDKVTLESGDFGISPEFSLKAQLKGFKLGEVPTTYKSRKEGIANFNMVKMSKRYLMIFLRAVFKW